MRVGEKTNFGLLFAEGSFELVEFFAFGHEKTFVSCLLPIEFLLPFTSEIFFDARDLTKRMFPLSVERKIHFLIVELTIGCALLA